ncbi:MAG: hypothetical protein AAFY71_23245 [Bacteroidota bacterium]
MKFFTSIIFALLATIGLQANQTFYTSASATSWSNPSSWVDANGQAINKVPSSEDDVVIRTYFTFDLTQDYTHTGKITVTGNGLFQIFSAEENNASFMYAGQEMSIYGYLLASVNFSVRPQNNGRSSILLLHETASMNFSGNLALESALILEESACGSIKIEGDLMITGKDAFICGEGNVNVDGQLRAFNEAGVEMNSSESQLTIEAKSCQEIRFHKTTENCNGAPYMIGQGNANQIMGINDFSLASTPTAVNISWELNKGNIVEAFVVERSFDGILFQGIAQIENIDTDIFEVLDHEVIQEKCFYRIKQVVKAGAPIYSPIKEFTPVPLTEEMGMNIFPNRIQSGESFRLVSDQMSESAQVKVVVKNIMGQIVSTDQVVVGPAGRVDVRIQAQMNKGWYVVSLEGEQASISQKIQVK